MEPSDDANLWHQAQDGDGRAFSELFRRCSGAVLRQALRFSVDAADAEEVAAAAFFELWRRRDQVRLVEGSPLPWLLATAANLGKNGLRAARRRQALLRWVLETHDRSAATPVDEVDIGVDRVDLAAALRQLSTNDAALLTLVALEGYGISEAAQVLGLSDHAARTRFYRIRQRLRPLLGHDGPPVVPFASSVTTEEAP